jgi:magnesium chelatase subunit D
VLFVLDTSGSMAAWRRMRQTKSAVLSLLLQGYQRRDRVALLAFRDQGAELVLPPTPSLRTARRILEGLPAGGATPLAHGLAAARQFLRNHHRRLPRSPAWTVLLTDGRANVGLGGDPWQDALAQARGLADGDGDFLVVDTETHWPRFGRAAILAQVLGANCRPLEEVLTRPLPDHWRWAV